MAPIKDQSMPLVHTFPMTERIKANTLNFEEKVCSLEKTLNNWKKRKLTLIGKINIVKTLGLSKLIYCSSLLTVSKSLIDRINKIIFSFIWEGKPPKIKKKTIIGEKHCGGLKMIDFEIMEQSLKIAWIKRIAESLSNALWKIIPNQALCQYGGLACIASVSSRGLSRKLGQKQKKKRMTGEGEGRRNRLPANPTILKNCVPQ